MATQASKHVAGSLASFRYQERMRRMRFGLPVTRCGRELPFGYIPDPTNAKMLIPVDTEFYALVRAFKYLRVSGYTAVSEWLTDVTGRSITNEGLRKLIEKRCPHPICARPLKERQQLFDEVNMSAAPNEAMFG